MATKPNRLSAARWYEGKLDESIQQRWYQQIEDTGNSGTSWSAITGGDGSPITGDVTLTSDDAIVLVDSSGGVVTITVPTAVGLLGRRYDIKKIDSSSNTVVIQPNGSETIDGCNPLIIRYQYTNRTIVSDGANWWII